MLSLSPLSAMSTDEEEDVSAMTTTPANGKKANANGNMECDGIASRLAFTYDLNNLDEDGTPKNKLARKLSRNESEKMRRDRLNAYIAELARLVPLIFSSSRKLDKASILRLTVTYLRIYHDLIKGGHSGIKWKPDFLTYENLGNLLLESVDGFLLVINQSGQLIFTTDAFTSLLGHSLVDVLGVSIYRLIHPEDEDILRQQFKGIKPSHDNNGTLNSDAGCSGHRSFYLRMAAKTNKPTIRYENIHIIGHLKVIPPPQSVNMGRSEPDLCLIGVGRVVAAEAICEPCPLPENNAKQWITRHEIDGTITFSDQRGALLTGFMPGESIGMPAYALVHPEDISSIVAVHNLMLTTGTVPITVFRMYTKSKDMLYIRNNAHIVIDMWTSKPKYIISINEVIDEEIGKYMLAEQHKTLKALPSNCDSGAPSSVSSDSSTGSTDEEKSYKELTKNTQQNDIILPEVIAENSGNVSVIVGNQKYEIVLANSKLSIKPGPDKTDSSQMIFDPDVHNDSGRKGIPLVKPVFLGDEGEQNGMRKSIYDDINAYLGNDPAVIGTVNCAKTNTSQISNGHRRHLDRSDSKSALSNLHAMIQNSCYSIGSSQSQANPQLNEMHWPNYELRHLESCNANNSSCHQSSGNSQAQAKSYTDYHQTNNSKSNYYSTHKSGSTNHKAAELTSNEYFTVHIPSTSTRHNPTLVQLLNTKTSPDSHIRETLTSHLVTDGSGVNGDTTGTCDIRNRGNSSVPLLDKLNDIDSSLPDDLNNLSLEQLQYHLRQQQQQQQQQQQPQQQYYQLQQIPQRDLIREERLQREIERDQQMKQMMESILQQQMGVKAASRHNQKQKILNGEVVDGTYNMHQNGSSDLCQQIFLEGLKELEEKRRARERELNDLRSEYIRKLLQVQPGSGNTGPTYSSHVNHVPYMYQDPDTSYDKGNRRSRSCSTDTGLPSCNSSSALSSPSFSSPYCSAINPSDVVLQEQCQDLAPLNHSEYVSSNGNLHITHTTGDYGGMVELDQPDSCELDCVDLSSLCTDAPLGFVQSTSKDQMSPVSSKDNGHTLPSNDSITLQQTTCGEQTLSAGSPMYQDVTSTSGDNLDQLVTSGSQEPLSPAATEARKSGQVTDQTRSPDHQAALNALLTQIAPSQTTSECDTSSGEETLHWIKALMSDPVIVNSLLDEYVMNRRHSDEGKDNS